MPTHLEYALMAQDAYNPPASARQIPNWNRLDDYTYEPSNQWGLGVVVYRNWCRTEYVIAFRGTYLSNFPIAFANLMTDLKLIYGAPPGAGLAAKTLNDQQRNVQQKFKNLISPSLDILNNFLKKIGMVSVSYTGHSLGAVIAEINACKTNRKAVTFESPGCDHLLTDKERVNGRNNVICYVHGSNFINSAFKHVGLIREIPYPLPFWAKAADGLNPKFKLMMLPAILYKQHAMDGIAQKFQDGGLLQYKEHKRWPLDEPFTFDLVIKVINLAAQRLGIDNPNEALAGVLAKAIDNGQIAAPPRARL